MMGDRLPMEETRGGEQPGDWKVIEPEPFDLSAVRPDVLEGAFDCLSAEGEE
jgi:hypothetical protein